MLIVFQKVQSNEITPFFFGGNAANDAGTREENIKSEALQASFLIGRDGQAAGVFHWLRAEGTLLQTWTGSVWFICTLMS